MRKGNLILNAVLVCSIVLFITCKKEVNTIYQTPLSDSSRISITNAPPAVSNLQFYLNNQPVSLPNAPLSFGQTAYAFYINDANPYHPDTTLLPYINISSGYQQLGFGSFGSSDIFSNLNDKFEPGNSYSVFITDTVHHGQITTVLLHDYVGKADSTKGQIRFLNLSPDAPPLDLWAYLNAGPNGYKVSSGCAYIPNDFNSFINAETFSLIDAGPYFFIATVAGTSNIVLEGQLFIPGQNVVTIYTKGYIAGTGANAIDVGVIQYQP
ncbi:MAG TPA: DUF4397 domain-containing protein [Puia sp.]